MKPLKSHLITLTLLFSALPACSGLALGFGKDRGVIWQASSNEFIKYSDRDKSADGNNNHPVNLDGDEISKILDSIKTVKQDDKSDDKEKHTPPTLFTAQQITLLGKYLAEGLAGARPDQDVIFALEKSIDRFIGLKPDRMFVAGRVFYKDNRLNLIIGDYDRPRNDAYEAAYDPTHTGIVRYHFNYGDRGKSSGFDKAVITVNGIEYKQLKSGRRNDWLVIDLNAASNSYDVVTQMHKDEELAEKRKELIEILDSDESAALDRSRPTEVGRRPLEERLTELKQLREKDLITEEEYAQKRKQLLNEL
jgi:hypothetical protein